MSNIGQARTTLAMRILDGAGNASARDRRAAFDNSFVYYLMQYLHMLRSMACMPEEHVCWLRRTATAAWGFS
jgi:hypothetical protein